VPVMDDPTNPARRLAAAIEPVAGQVYFSPECHRNYAALGFNPSVAKAGAVELPDGPAYFTSRGSVMGQVPGEVVASAFGVFNPKAVVPSVAYGWTLTDAATICKARDDGAIAQLIRILGEEPEDLQTLTAVTRRMVDVLRPEGRPLYSGLRSLAMPEHPVGAMWRMLDMLREFRGDSHTAAWISAGLDAVEIGLLTELWLGLPMRSYIRTRAWSDEDLDAAVERLQSRGWIDAEGVGFTDAGRIARSIIEQTTDLQMADAIRELGDDAEEMFAVLSRWGRAIRAAGGYLAGGADDLAKRGQADG
jgi:hypothetical protein